MHTVLSILSYAKVYLILNNLLSGEEQDHFPPFFISLRKQPLLFPKNMLYWQYCLYHDNVDIYLSLSLYYYDLCHFQLNLWIVSHIFIHKCWLSIWKYLSLQGKIGFFPPPKWPSCMCVQHWNKNFPSYQKTMHQIILWTF